MGEVDRGWLLCWLVRFSHMVRVARCTSGKDVGLPDTRGLLKDQQKQELC